MYRYQFITQKSKRAGTGTVPYPYRESAFTGSAGRGELSQPNANVMAWLRRTTGTVRTTYHSYHYS